MAGAMKVLAVTGASGGHIFPAMGFLDSLEDKYKNIETLLVLPRRSLKSNIHLHRHRVQYLSSSSIGYGIHLKNLIALFKFFQGFLESLIIFLKFKPDVVVGFGSLDTIPLVLIAWMARTRTLIHEQNCIPGRANRLLAKFSDKIAISFAQTQGYFKAANSKIVLTGNPMRRELKSFDRPRALSFFGFDEDKITILVMGGSAGSHKINTSFLGAVSAMPDALRLQIIHIAGSTDFQFLESAYKRLNLKVKLFIFLKEMQYAYSASSLVICRAGATTMAELALYRNPAILIPYPFAYQHQLTNAKILESHNCAVVINEDDLEENKLRNILVEFLAQPGKLNLMRSNYNNITRVNANDLFVEAVMSLS